MPNDREPEQKKPDPDRIWTLALWGLGIVILCLMTYEYTAKH